MDTLSSLLSSLPSRAADHALDDLELDAWRRIDQGTRNRSAVRLQVAVAALTLISGLAVGSLNVRHGPSSMLSYAEAGPWTALRGHW